jgi:dTDP-4-amino-4,6-dideoxygalactose transaminase
MTPPRIPLVDLGVVNGVVGSGLRAAFERVMASSGFTGGEEVEKFEHELARHLGVAHVVSVASGTAALHLALAAAGVGRGDEVILPPNTFFATAEAVMATGATPVLADVAASTALLDPDAVAAVVTSRTAAIIPVHLYGQPVDGDRFADLARRHGLLLLEDAAQAFGASWRGRPAGTLGTAGAFSFYPSKNLGALGDGGAVTTSDAALARSVRLLRSHGEERRHEHLVAGSCERLDGLQAAFLRTKLAAFDQYEALREDAVGRYHEQLPAITDAELFVTDSEARHANHLLVLRVPHRDRLLKLLHDAGVGAAVHYPMPIHLQPATATLGSVGQFPVAEALADSVISLPLYPGMTHSQIDRCVHALSEALGRVA